MATQRSPDEDATPVVPLHGSTSSQANQFAAPTIKGAEYTDGRLPGDWESKYPPPARRCINQEACVLGILLLLFSLLSGGTLGLSSSSMQIPVNFLAGANGIAPPLQIDFRIVATFFVGCLGGTTFSIKWLIHSAAKRKWHLDRRYWRFFVPLIGGIYACVVLTLLDGGVIGNQSPAQPRSMALTAAFAFLVGYFSDGVSGLLSNIANAVFGTLERK